ncbi:MAG TPA: APC family permease [Planctomycetota bacterium]|nr:APC family permease [Planctomycetota bacterium]
MTPTRSAEGARAPGRDAGDGGLRRTLGLPSLLFYGVGVIIGGGIYSIIGAAAGEAGRRLWVSLLLASVPAALAALCYAELSTRFPRAGASYVYVREATPNRSWPRIAIGFVTASAAAATAATVSVAFAGYFEALTGTPAWIGAPALLVVCTAVNLRGIRESAWVTAVATSVEALGLVLIIGAGVRSGRFFEGAVSDAAAATGWSGVFAAAALCFFVYTGFEGLANLAEETRDPARRLPPALLISLVLTTVLYLLTALAATALVEPARLAESASPLSTAAEAADPRLATALAWIALFATGNTALITVIVSSRLLFGMAKGGDMPAALSRTLPRRRTPWVAALTMLAAATAMLPLGGADVLGSIASLLTLVDFLAVGAALVAVRLRESADGRPTRSDVFRIPVSFGRVPAAPVVMAVAVALLATQFRGVVYVVAAGVVLAAAVFARLRARALRDQA